MQFGIALKPDISIERIVGLTRQAESAGFEYRLDFRFARFVEGTVSAAHADGHEYEAHAPGYVRHESRDSGSHRDRQLVRNPQSDFRRADGTRHRPRRQFPARDGQEAGELVATGSRGRGVPRSHFRQRSAARRSTHAPQLGERFSAGMDCGLWSQGAAHGRPSGRRNHFAVCRSRL